MRITKLHVDAFGIWSDKELSDLPDHLGVVYGPNEAGKTTLMQLVRTVLYGFSPERRRRFLPPREGDRPGGALRVSTEAGQYEIARHTSLTAPPDDVGAVRIVAADGAEQGAHFLQTLLGGVDEAVFSNVFAVGLRELQQLGTLNDTDAADYLYSLTSGLDRVSLVQVMRELTTERNALLGDDGETSQLVELAERRDALRQEVTQLARGATEWARLFAQRSALEQEGGRLEELAAEQRELAAAIETALKVRPQWRQRQQIDGRLEALGPLARLSDDATERLVRLTRQLVQRRRQAEQLRSEREQQDKQFADLPLNRALWRNAPRIEAVLEQRGWIESLRGQIDDLTAQRDEWAAKLDSQQQQIGLQANVQLEKLPHITEHTLDALRGPARTLQAERQKLKQAQQHITAEQQAAEDIDSEVATALSERGHDDLAGSIETAGQRVQHLRRRIQIEERLDQLGRHRRQLQEESDAARVNQALTVEQLIVLGVFFTCFMAVALGGLADLVGNLFGFSVAFDWGCMLVGGIGVAVSVGAKSLMRQRAEQQWHDGLRQTETADGQMEKLKQERDEIDRSLPQGGGPLVSRLEAAEKQLSELESLTPLGSQQQEARERSRAARRQAEHLESELNEANHKWRKALHSVGLPATLTPKHVRMLGERLEELTDLRRRLAAAGDQLQQRSVELAGVEERILQLLIDSELECDGDDCLEQLQQLAAALRQQETVVAQHRQLRRSRRKLVRSYKRCGTSVRRLQQQRSDMLAKVGADDHVGHSSLIERCEQIRSLRAERDQAGQQITLAADGYALDQLTEHLDHASDEQLRTRLDELTQQSRQADTRLGELQQRRGSLTQQIETMSRDRRLAEKQLELDGVERQLASATRRWRVLAVTSLLLHAIRQTYERDRQPETLREASQYLARMTADRYRRIWTPLGEDALRVDEADGQSLSIEKLSRGTREQVFLSLRLALVAAYARRGIAVPLILDDVLVNFDSKRVEAAARLLKQFAADGHQLLVFTCHEHVAQVFRSLQVQVRELTSGATQFVEPEPIVEEEEYVEDEVELTDDDMLDEPEEEELEDEYEEEEEEYEEDAYAEDEDAEEEEWDDAEPEEEAEYADVPWEEEEELDCDAA